MVRPLWKTVWGSLIKLNLLLPQGLAIALIGSDLGIYLKESRTYVHTKACTWMFKAALFTIASAWKQQDGLFQYGNGEIK